MVACHLEIRKNLGGNSHRAIQITSSNDALTHGSGTIMYLFINNVEIRFQWKFHLKYHADALCYEHLPTITVKFKLYQITSRIHFHNGLKTKDGH